MEISWKHLEEAFQENQEARNTFTSFKDFLLSDLDLGLFDSMGGHLEINFNKSIVIDEKSINILKEIAEMDDIEHIRAYEEYGLFHDGGDDFDYGGSYVAILYDIIIEAKKKGETK